MKSINQAQNGSNTHSSISINSWCVMGKEVHLLRWKPNRKFLATRKLRDGPPAPPLPIYGLGLVGKVQNSTIGA